MNEEYKSDIAIILTYLLRDEAWGPAEMLALKQAAKATGVRLSNTDLLRIERITDNK